MTQRFCSRCNAEVEDTGGFCLLGHNLRLEAPADSLSALRAEVNRTFDEAREQLAEVMAPVAAVTPVVVTPPERSVASSPLPPSPAPHRAAQVPRPPSVTLDDTPTPADPNDGRHHTVWESLEDHEALTPDDPIAAFAPPPRMDWGPSRASRRRRNHARLQPES